MKVYTYSDIHHNFELSIVRNFFNGEPLPQTYRFTTDAIDENCLLFTYAMDLIHNLSYDAKERIKYVQNKKIVLLYHHKNLGVPNFSQMQQLITLKNLLTEMNFNEKQIYFICQLKGDIPLIKEYLGNINITYFCKWMDEFRDCQIYSYLKRFPGRNVNIFPNREYKKLSICIRRFDQDRLNFMSNLVDEDLIDSFNFSFTNHLGPNCRDTISLDEVKSLVPNTVKNKDKVNSWIDNMPYVYGNDIESPYPLELDSLIVNSYVNVAFETSPREDTCVISEKVYKPIFLLKPFIVISQPYALKLLKDSGFITFGDFIDESYDNILDYDERIKAITSEIKRIQNMEHRELCDMQHNMHGIFVHNLELLMSYSFSPLSYNMTYQGIKND